MHVERRRHGRTSAGRGKKKGTDHLLGLRKGIPSHRLMEGEGWAQQRRMGEGIGSEMQLEK